METPPPGPDIGPGVGPGVGTPKGPPPGGAYPKRHPQRAPLAPQGIKARSDRQTQEALVSAARFSYVKHTVSQSCRALSP